MAGRKNGDGNSERPRRRRKPLRIPEGGLSGWDLAAWLQRHGFRPFAGDNSNQPSTPVDLDAERQKRRPEEQ